MRNKIHYILFFVVILLSFNCGSACEFKSIEPDARRSVFRYVALKASVLACDKAKICKQKKKTEMKLKENIECKVLTDNAKSLCLRQHRQSLVTT